MSLQTSDLVSDSASDSSTTNTSSSNSLTKFDGTNFVSWRFQMKCVLMSLDLWDSSEDGPKDSSKAFYTICLSVKQSQVIYVSLCTTAKEAWKSLSDQFASKSFNNSFRLKRNFFGKKLEEGGNVETHIRELKTVALELASLGQVVSDTDQICVLLNSLPESYGMFVASLMNNVTDKSTIADVTSRLMNEHLLKKESSSKTESAFNSNASKFSATARKCTYCKKPNHVAERCWKRMADEKAEHNSVVLKTSENKLIESYDWFIDSGASAHMCFKRSWFSDFHDLEEEINIMLANSSVIKAKGVGTVYMKFDESTVKFCDVLYVPELTSNLISISKMIKSGNRAEFDESAIHCLDQHGNIFASGTLHGNLYRLKGTPIQFESSNFVNNSRKQTNSLEIWHHRLGHLNYNDVISLEKRNLASGINLNNRSIPDDLCPGCKFGKMSRKPFPSSSTRATKILEIIHSDVCGPFKTPTFGGKLYFITFIDDYSRYSVVYLLRKKSEAFEKFKEFILSVTNMKERNVGEINANATTIKILRTDNGGEFTSNSFDTFCKAKGILHQLTAPYSAQQNGVAERMNRTLVEAMRSMIHQSNVPLQFWGEALLTAVYIRNRCPNSSIDGKTPFENWTGNTPDIQNLRIFWSDAFAHVPKEKRTKLDAKAIRCKFLGYSDQQKAYRLWNPITRKIIVSRDVDFNEHTILENFKLENPLIPQDCLSPAQTEPSMILFDQENTFLPNVEPVGVEPNIITHEEEFYEPYEEFEYFELDQPNDPVGEVIVPLPEEINDANENLDNHAAPPIPAARRSSRISRPPHRFWETSNIASSEVTEPSSFRLAKSRPDSVHWMKAANSEYQSLIDNETWVLAELPKGKNVVGSKWVFKVKYNADGSVERYKARLVAKGYSQIPGLDYYETFAPVAKLTSIRTILAIAAQRDMEIHQMDVKTAFLNGDLTEEIYMEQPEGFESDDANLVCKLKKTIYGLKQSPRAWNIKLDTFLKSLGFIQSTADPCIYVKWESQFMTIISVYVDDLIIACDSTENLLNIKNALNQKFSMTDLGELHYCLGMQITRKRKEKSIFINQEKYIHDMLSKFGMDDCKPVSTPLEPISNNETIDQNSVDMSKIPYRSAVGSIMYAMVGTRPDIAAAFGYVSRYLDKPEWKHWIAVKRIFRYLKGTMDSGISFKFSDENNINLVGFADSDWASDPVDRKSISGYVFMLSNGPISWKSKKQPTIALSSTEAEYISATLAVQESIWLRKLLVELSHPQDNATIIYEDNQGCIALSKNAAHHNRTKHIDIKYHFIREKIANNIIKLIYIPTNENIADLFTKGLNRLKFEELRQKLGINPKSRLSGSVVKQPSISECGTYM